ncbi:hypothetical protein COCON_G00117870 [Conger conger]|uniref:Uncharacterized protein n=1 Tax=Conger conger TaxID=82655 RepID=A0A9Q1DH10_CONCO|nr:hypothetical protein COCON_G00117870 [Conger conger]
MEKLIGEIRWCSAQFKKMAADTGSQDGELSNTGVCLCLEVMGVQAGYSCSLCVDVLHNSDILDTVVCKCLDSTSKIEFLVSRSEKKVKQPLVISAKFVLLLHLPKILIGILPVDALIFFPLTTWTLH